MLNRVKSVMLMTLLGLILVSAGGYVGGQNGATMMFIIALILNFYSYWNSDKIVLKAYNAKELSENQVPELFSLVKGLSRNAGIPMPRLYIIPTEIPNAFATGRNENHAAVAVTEGLISLLDRDEIAVSYTHLDVYKRQGYNSCIAFTLCFEGALSRCVHYLGDT